jgi:hypothetical protein
METKPTLGIDFDNTIAGYSKGWQGPGNIVEEPIADAKWALDLLSKHFNIVIFSCRAATEVGKKAIAEYMDKYKLPFVEITDKKPEGILVDDNCVRFDGKWKQTVREVSNFENWSYNASNNKNNG